MMRLGKNIIAVFVLLVFLFQQSSVPSIQSQPSSSMLAPFLYPPAASSFSAERINDLLGVLDGMYPEIDSKLKKLLFELAPHKHQRLEEALLKHAKTAKTGISVFEWYRLMRKNEVWKIFYKLLRQMRLSWHEIADIGRIAVLVDDLFADDEDFVGVVEHIVHVAHISGNFIYKANELNSFVYTAGIRKRVVGMTDVNFYLPSFPVSSVLLNVLLNKDYIAMLRLYMIPDVVRAALLHDLGKFFIPSEVLNFPGKHSEEQRNIMRLHSIFSYLLCRYTGYSQEISDIVLHHHEHPCGDGYPDGLMEEDVTWQMRLISTADVFSALGETRSYKKGLPWHSCLTIMHRMAKEGVLDKDMVSLFEGCLNCDDIEACA